MPEIIKRIKARIAQLDEELTTFVSEVNRQIAAQQGAIQALEMLLNELSEGDEEE